MTATNVRPPTPAVFESLVGRVVVVKVGGSLGDEGTVLEDVVRVARLGVRLVVVHGGGPRITELLGRLGVETRFVAGRRHTDDEALRVAHMALAELNGRIVARLQQRGVPAVGLSGLDGGFLRARVRDPQLGHVGDVQAVDRALVDLLHAAGFTLVVAPIAAGPDWQPLNVNADSVAGEVARALDAASLVLCTDVPGVLDASGALLARVERQQVPTLVRQGVIRGGMLPKIEAALRALERVPRVHVLDGRQPGALLAALGSPDPPGTALT